MITLTFDTLKFVETLKEAGMPEKQAKAISAAVQEAHEAAELATKSDIREVKTEMREMELRIDTRFERIDGEMKLLKWMMGIIMGGVIALILKAFFPV